jgi:hypothetical protein
MGTLNHRRVRPGVRRERSLPYLPMHSGGFEPAWNQGSTYGGHHGAFAAGAGPRQILGTVTGAHAVRRLLAARDLDAESPPGRPAA